MLKRKRRRRSSGREEEGEGGGRVEGGEGGEDGCGDADLNFDVGLAARASAVVLEAFETLGAHHFMVHPKGEGVVLQPRREESESGQRESEKRERRPLAAPPALSLLPPSAPPAPPPAPPAARPAARPAGGGGLSPNTFVADYLGEIYPVGTPWVATHGSCPFFFFIEMWVSVQSCSVDVIVYFPKKKPVCTAHSQPYRWAEKQLVLERAQVR
jgi:hypothetical protein